ncbi:MAG: peroxiredoxin [Parvularculaceae bacterium]
MAIAVGDKIPNATLMLATANGPEKVDAATYCGSGKTALFAVPGAFSPTCSAQHLPGFVAHADEIKAKGVDRIACVSVNDAFVMGAWGAAHGADGKVEMVADGNGEFARALGLTMDGAGYGMGERSQRYSAVIEDGVVKTLNVEEGGAFEASSAERMLEQL